MASGDGKVTLADVAKRCRVSISAVSLALHRDPERCKLAAATRERIIAAARELGYQPNWAGRALQAQRSGLIGALHTSPQDALNMFSSRLLGALATALRADDRDLVLVPVDAGGGWRRRLLDRRLDAAVVLGDLPPEAVDELDPQALPLVHLNAPRVGGRRSGEIHIGFDDDDAVAQACDHLAARGHRRIAWIGMEGSLHGSGAIRDRAYRRWCGRSGRTPEVVTRITLIRSLAAGTNPTGVACFSDDTAMSLLRDCWTAGVAVPGQLAVTGINDLEATAHAIPALTTVRLPLAAAAERTASAIDACLAGRRPPSLVLRGELVVRASS